MNKEKLIKQYDEKAKALRDEFISKLEDDKEEFKLTYPDDGEMLYYFEVFEGEIYDTYYSNNSKVDKYIFEHGLYFNSKEEVEQYIKERKLLFKLQQWAKEKNDGWEPNWEEVSQYKFSIDYSSLIDGLWVTDATVQKRFNKLPFFKSEQLAQECIDLFGKEIKEVLV